MTINNINSGYKIKDLILDYLTKPKKQKTQVIILALKLLFA